MPVCQNCGRDNPADARFCASCGTALAPAPVPAAPEETRRIVSVVFCDLKGSTALGESIDPEALRQVIARYFADMRAVIERHGGVVEKFIGDAVMGAFGIPTLHEDDAMRAVRAADEMQKAMQVMNTDLQARFGASLAARIGVNTGEVMAGDPSAGHGFVSGDAVNVAARLEQAAAPGEVLIGDPTYRLVRDAVEVEEVEPLELKGKADRVRAYRLRSVSSELLGHVRRLDSPLVGRTTELTALRSVFDQAVAAKAGILATVIGTAGAGKSRLTQDFLSSVQDEAVVVRGRCLSYGEGQTFGPIAGAIRSASGITPEDSPESALTKLGVLLSDDPEGELVKERVAAAIGLTGSAGDAQETFWAVRHFLAAIARDRPLVLVIDDIHWAEPTMLDLIEYLAGYSQGLALMLLCLTRPDLLDARPSWGTSGTRIALEPLGEGEVRALIENLLGQAQLPPNVAHRVTAAAEGNPLYVEEMLRMLIDDGLLIREGDTWRAGGDLSQIETPGTIQALIAARLDRLNAYEKAVAQRGAAIGTEFWWGAVTHLAPEDLRPHVPAHMQSLIRKELIRPSASSFAGEDALRFSHVLIQHTAYEQMPKGLRASLHESFATWLEQKAGDRVGEYEEILGYHLEQTFKLRDQLGAVDEDTRELGRKASRFLASAGERALARGDAPAAAGLLRRAAELRSDVREKALLFIHSSRACLEIGEIGNAVETAQLIEALDVDDLVTAHARVHKLFVRELSEEPDDDWIEEARRTTEETAPVFDAAGDKRGLVRALRLQAESHWVAQEYEATGRVLSKALTVAEEAGDELQELEMLAELPSVLYWGPVPAASALERCTKILELVRSHPVARAKCMVALAGLRAMVGSFEDARQARSNAKRDFLDLGQSRLLGVAAQIFGYIELLAGDPEAAEREFREGYGVLQAIGDRGHLPLAAALVAASLYPQGRYEECHRITEHAIELAGDDDYAKLDWGPVKAKLLARAGELESADILAREALAISTRGDEIATQADVLMDVATVFNMKGDTETAKESVIAARYLYEKKGVKPAVDRATARMDELTST